MLVFVSAFASWALVTGFFIWLLIYCLRRGVVGGGISGPDAHRSEQPIRFWFGIVALTGGAIGSIGIFVFAVWRILT
jgi:hypothetical protein